MITTIKKDHHCTYIVGSQSERSRVTRLGWGINKSSQEVDTG